MYYFDALFEHIGRSIDIEREHAQLHALDRIKPV